MSCLGGKTELILDESDSFRDQKEAEQPVD